MVWVGIDWSDTSHSVNILDMPGNKLDCFDIPHSQDGFESLHRRIMKRVSSPQDAPVAIETSDSLIVDFLSELGYTLYFLNPKQTDRFRDRHRMSRSKTDPFDAYVLADALRTDMHLFNSLSPLDEESLTLRVLTRTREGAVGRKVAIQNELVAYLKRYYPVSLQLFGGIDNREAIGFLLAYPSYEQARRLSQAQIASVLEKQGVSRGIAAKHATAAHKKLKQAQPRPAPAVGRAYPLAVVSLLRQFQAVLEEIQALEAQIRDAYEHHPNKDLLESLPGVAEVLGPVLAAEIGTDVTRFASLKTLKAFAGTSPVTQQSGRYRGVHFRRACNTHVRRALHLASQSAISQAGWARELYDRLRVQGKTYGRALRAVANQLVEMLYSVLLRRTPYDEGYHLRMKAVHGGATATI
jgi:transposase